MQTHRHFSSLALKETLFSIILDIDCLPADDESILKNAVQSHFSYNTF